MQKDNRHDALLAIRCQLGERDAWDELVRRWHPRLWRFVARMLPDSAAADDVSQSVWLRVVHSLLRLRDPERLGVWLFSIARAATADALRAAYRAPEPRANVDIAEQPRETTLPELKDLLATSLDDLHAVDREAVVLHYLEDLSVARVAEICRVPPGTIKSRLHRARGKLRENLTRENQR